MIKKQKNVYSKKEIEDVFIEHTLFLRTYFFRRMKDRQISEDLTQVVFENILKFLNNDGVIVKDEDENKASKVSFSCSGLRPALSS